MFNVVDGEYYYGFIDFGSCHIIESERNLIMCCSSKKKKKKKKKINKNLNFFFF